jgi:hypothetical protein
METDVQKIRGVLYGMAELLKDAGESLETDLLEVGENPEAFAEDELLPMLAMLTNTLAEELAKGIAALGIDRATLKSAMIADKLERVLRGKLN